MELGHDLLFFFAALGAFNSLLLGLYVLFNWRKYSRSHIFLGLLLLEHAVRVGFSCLYFFNDAPREYIKLGLSAHLLIGPTLYYFVSLRLKPEGQRTGEGLIHLLIMATALITLGFAFDFEMWDFTFRYTIHLILTMYLSFTGVLLIPVFKKLFDNNGSVIVNKQALIVYATELLICLGFAISLYVSYILGPVCFSILLYGAVYLFFRIEKQANVVLSYQKKLDEVEVKKVEDRLTFLMSEEKLFRDSNLTLEKLSKELTVSKYFLSQMLNDNLNKRYHEFIAEYRIEDACELLLSSEHLTLEAIAYEVGFNSKSSFFSAFKRLKGSTPSGFREQAKV